MTAEQKKSKKAIEQVEIREILRSQIVFAPYNPKKHTDSAIRQQLKNLLKIGYLGGIVWNETTGNLVSGHKRIMAFDLHYRYDGTSEKDYKIKAGVVHLDEKTEKEQNIYMDARSTNTEQDYDLIAEILPEIDYRNAGLTDEDIQFIGVDYGMATVEEKDIAADFVNLSQPQREQNEDRKQAVKEAKKMVMDKASEKVKDMVSYVVLNFDTYRQKAFFMQRFGYNPDEKYIKGELFAEQVERID
jgi:hypothetical protein